MFFTSNIFGIFCMQLGDESSSINLKITLKIEMLSKIGWGISFVILMELLLIQKAKVSLKYSVK